MSFARLSPRVGLCLVLACVAPISASAAVPARDTNPDSALKVTLDQIEGQPLTIAQAIDFARDGATLIRGAEAVLRAARGAVVSERGRFDPELFVEIDRTREDLPTASPFAGATVLATKETVTESGVRIRLPIGTEVRASLNTSRFQTNSRFASLNPRYDSFGMLQIKQPLLEGFGASARRELSSAERMLEAAEARYRDAVLQVRSRVEETYWELYAAERDLAVQMLIRDHADALVKEADLRARAGLAGPNQVANGRVFLAKQELGLLDREEQFEQISDRLASLIGRRPERPHARFRPTDEPPEDFPIEDINQLLDQVRAQNHGLRAARADIAVLRELADGVKRDRLPTVDLLGSIGGSGLSGKAQDVVFAVDTLRSDFTGEYADSWRQVLRREFPAWTVGLNINIPIGSREGRGEHARLRAEVLRADQQYVALSRSLEERVRRHHRELVNGRRRRVVAEQGLEAAQEQVRIGLIEFRNGRSTAFELVLLGSDLAEAEQRYSQALVRHAKAAAVLKYLTSEGP